MSDRIIVERSGGVADVRLNRPDKLNGLDAEMFLALDALGDELAADKSVRCVVLSGNGRSFCAGLDFGAVMSGGFQASGRNLMDRPDGAVVNLAQRAAHVWTALPMPVIAAVHGHCYGGGLQMALAADMRIVSPDAKLSVMEIKWGLIPDMTGSQTLRHLVRIDVAKELTFTGRIIDGREAAALGLATRLSDNPHADALALAREIASKSPSAIRAGKALFERGYVGSTEAGLLLEETLQKTLIGKPNQMEAVTANFEKREANFAD